MSNWIDFLYEVLASGLISAVLLSIAAFLGKSQISHFLNKDIERVKIEFQKDLEKIKSDNQTALEAYKVSLISETERKKAEQSIKTSVAIKFSEHQFNAVNAINIAYADMGQQALSILGLYESAIATNPQAIDKIKILSDDFYIRSKALTSAIFSANFFMKDEEIKLLQKYDSLICGIVELAINKHMCRSGIKSDLMFARQDFLDLKTLEEQIEFVNKEEYQITLVLRTYADKFLKMHS